MRIILIVLMCIGLSACNLTPAPDAIKKGTMVSAQLAAVNQNNIKTINGQYYAGFKSLIEGVVKKEQAKQEPDYQLIEDCTRYLTALEQLHKRLKETTYPVTAENIFNLLISGD